MGDFDAALGHHLHQVAIRQSIGDIPTHAELNHVSVERPLAVDWVTGDRLRHSARVGGGACQFTREPPT